jgi:hypothetical protein
MAFTVNLLTDAGNRLYADAVGKTPQITRFALGGARVSAEQIATLTDLPAPIKDAPITRIRASGNVTEITAQINNAGIAVETGLYAVGIYAKLDDDPEILLAVCSLGADDKAIPIPPETLQMPEFCFDFLIPIAHGSTAGFTAIVNVSAYVTVGQVGQTIVDLLPRFFLSVSIITAFSTLRVYLIDKPRQHVIGIDDHRQFFLCARL